ARQAPRGPGIVAALLPLARAQQAQALGRGAGRLVRSGTPGALRDPPPSARAQRRGHPPAHGPQGPRQNRGNPDMTIQVREHGAHVAVVTIDNQARRNAMTRAMLAELARLWETLERGPCRCIVLTGAGERAFSSGADVSGDLSADPDTARVVND